MSQDSDQHCDARRSGVALEAEAALLEARIRMLQEAIDSVDSRIRTVSESLRRLGRAASSDDS